MKVLTSKKAIIAILSLGSIVLAGTIKDINSRTVSRKQALAELLPTERGLASNEDAIIQKIALMEIGMNEAYKIDGQWEITRIVGADEKVTFDKFNNAEDANKTIKVPMKLVGKSLVMVNNDPGLQYHISLLSEFGTIAITKKMGDGYEILEAKMIKVAKEDEQVADSGDKELVLERALNQEKSSKILTGSDASGEMLYKDKSFEGLRIALTNSNGEEQSIDIPKADIMEGGAFRVEQDGEEISGVIFPNGKEGYRLSFVTGPLKGAMLNFVTRDELERIQEKEGELNDTYYQAEEQAPVVAEQPVAEEVQPKEVPMNNEMAQEQELSEQQVLEERREIAANPESAEPVNILSAEEVEQTAQTQGYNF